MYESETIANAWIRKTKLKRNIKCNIWEILVTVKNNDTHCNHSDKSTHLEESEMYLKTEEELAEDRKFVVVTEDSHHENWNITVVKEIQLECLDESVMLDTKNRLVI